MLKAIHQAAVSYLKRQDKKILGPKYFSDQLAHNLVELKIRAQLWMTAFEQHVHSENFKQIEKFARDNRIPFERIVDTEEFIAIKFRLKQISDLPEIDYGNRIYNRSWCLWHGELFDDVGYLLTLLKDPVCSEPLRSAYEKFYAAKSTSQDSPSAKITLDLFDAYTTVADSMRERSLELGIPFPPPAHSATPTAHL